MNDKRELQLRRTAILDEQQALCDAAEEQNGGVFSEEQQTQFDALAAELTGVDETLTQIAAHEDRVRKIRENRNDDSLVREPSAPAPRITRQHDNIQDDPNRGFANAGEFWLKVMQAGANPEGDADLMRAAAGTGATSGVAQDGGVLVPPAFSTRIWDEARKRSESLLSYCDNIPIDPGVESITVNAINETSRADGSRWGGVRGYWKDELTQLTSSQWQLREVKLEPQELYVYQFVSDKLLRRAPGAATSLIESSAADEISFKVGDSIINGDGAGKPTGIVGHASAIDVAKESGQAATTIVAENIDKMYMRCHANWRSGAMWLYNQDCEAELQNLTQDVGTGGQVLYRPAGGLSDSPYGTLKGLPTMPCEYCATLGTSGDLILVNLRAYAVAVRGMVDSNYSMHLKFDYAQTAFRLIFEVDGQPWLQSAITAYKGTNTYSPIVTLATRS